MKWNVLILDGNQRSALAATRSLGKNGVRVVVADDKQPCLSSCSRYCSDSFTYPSPYESAKDFQSTIRREVMRRNIHVLFPMTEITTQLILENKAQFYPTVIPFADFPSFDNLTDKWKLFKTAQRLQVPCPKTWFVSPDDDIQEFNGKFSYPIVLKPYRSRILYNGKWHSTSVRYANSWEELFQITRQFPFDKHKFLIQEKVEGTGQGVFALYDNGKPIVFFAHRRIREKPPTGGVSVLRESVPVDPMLKHIATKLLHEVKWHGVAMVEFKVTQQGLPFLMEVNARFWGSLQLAIDAGVDFPFLLYKIAVGKKIDPLDSYKLYTRTRWLLGDLDHLYLSTVRRSEFCPSGYPGRSRCLLDFLNFLDRRTKLEVLRLDDIKPFIFELREYLK